MGGEDYLAATIRTLMERAMPATTKSNHPQLKTLTPVMLVDAVEPCLPFWVDRFGFVVENQVPGPDGKLIFASAKKDGIEVMYQTKASVVAEHPETNKELGGHSLTLFITVDDIDVAEKAAAGAPV